MWSLGLECDCETLTFSGDISFSYQMAMKIIIDPAQNSLVTFFGQFYKKILKWLSHKFTPRICLKCVYRNITSGMQGGFPEGMG